MRAVERRRNALAIELQAASDDHRRLAEIGAALADADADLATAEDDWLSLSEEAGA